MMGGITASCQHCRIGCWSLLGYSRSLLRVVGHCLMRKFSVHPVPRVHIVPSGMLRAHQGERDWVQSKNPAVAGLQDPRTLLSTCAVIERPVSWPHASRPPALRMLPSSLIVLCIATITFNASSRVRNRLRNHFRDLGA